MAVAAPSRSQLNRSGKRLAKLRMAVRSRQLRIADLTPEESSRYMDDIKRLDRFRGQHAYPLRIANANLRYYVRGRGGNVTQRLKKFPTILDKLDRFPSMQLTTMEDIAGLRAVLPDQDTADAVARRLRKNWTIHLYRDYVRDPKDSGYRALHLIAVKKGVFVEIQLRTVLQDVWANQVEHDSRALRTDYKFGRGAAEVHGYYVFVSELFSMRERGVEPTDDFMRELVGRYNLAKPFLSTETE